MQIFSQLEAIPANFGPTIVAIGNFDGVHRGHRLVLDRILERAQARNMKAVALTFDPHPVRIVRPQQPLELITPLPEKLRLLSKSGIDATVVVPFTAAFAQTSAEDFARNVLASRLHASEVHEGDNFRFGKGAEAGNQELAELGRTLGFHVFVYPGKKSHGIPASSSAVRSLVASGDVRRARWLLGRAFSIEAPPATGRGIGTKLTVPTINLAPYPHLVPANGVYVTQLEVSGRCFDAVTNVGNRPTFGEDSFAIESYILDFTPFELDYTQPVRLHFLARIREERKWPSPEALKQQIMQDVAKAQRYLPRWRAAHP